MMSLMGEHPQNVDCGVSAIYNTKPAPLNEPLLPFEHQVGGHSALSHAAGRVWKPMIKKEVTFYQRIWAEESSPECLWIRDWTPRYYGLFEREELAEDRVTPQTSSGPLGGRVTEKPGQREGSRGSEVQKKSSPWGKKLSEIRKRQKPMRLYVCLEDLTAKFYRPCILDVKLGVRTYDDDASPEKKLRHQEKVRNTTSGKYGVRLSGMQVYMRREGDYLFRDKYHGRTLKREGLVTSFRDFFDNGDGLRRDVVSRCKSKLECLKSYVDAQRLFYFYSSSLLIVYEGDEEVTKPSVDVRMIDFAHTQPSFDRSDPGCSLGVSTLVKILDEILEEG
uniref:Kinase n=1 Tax=Rhodosorus marinus TaxID=101924 RepID=A0A7S0BL78_9RHOD|mmetsp:Transcript_22034/g.31898  ORF Transcript_22034/g.31898 Transcript_22034/m.31898 type:complete len:334 (+) Transcript_22034:372-1373(+)